ncbi:MAG: sigma-70 family RNA polymerase sigma factor [Bacteroidota bacterium]
MEIKDFKSELYALKDKVLRFAFCMMNDSADAEDVAQEVLLKLWSKRDGLKEVKNLEAYAMRMVRNMSLNKLEAPRRRQDSIEDVTLIDQKASPLKVAEDKDLLSIMQSIIQSLPENQRTVVQLRSIEGYALDEVAEITEMTENNVRVTLSRARQKIKEIFDGKYQS